MSTEVKKDKPAVSRVLTIQKIAGSVFGIGYIKGGGTIAAAVCAFFVYGWYLITRESDLSGADTMLQLVFLPLVTIVLFVMGVWAGNGVEASWGKDSSRVVLDEVVGMLVAIMFHPLGWRSILAGLILFRIFDIAKPLGIRRTEDLPGGWGVMVDDVIAGLYSSIVLLIPEHFNWV